LIHTFVILQIELTIRWNGITDLGGVGNVGQLIPLLVGVGGLSLVVARGIEGACKGVSSWKDDSGKDGRNDVWENFLGAFEEWMELNKESRARTFSEVEQRV
jgi:hypothetical protein